MLLFHILQKKSTLIKVAYSSEIYCQTTFKQSELCLTIVAST
jgi:hypothetical protein